MASTQIIIDDSTIFDNIDAEQVEFSAEVDAEEYEFALSYGVLEALSGDVPDGDAALTFHRFIDPISDAALSALARDSDATPIVIGEDDLG